MWSVDTIDWQKPTPNVLIDRVMSKIHNGAIILMHPLNSTEQSLDTINYPNIREKACKLIQFQNYYLKKDLLNQHTKKYTEKNDKLIVLLKVKFLEKIRSIGYTYNTIV